MPPFQNRGDFRQVHVGVRLETSADCCKKDSSVLLEKDADFLYVDAILFLQTKTDMHEVNVNVRIEADSDFRIPEYLRLGVQSILDNNFHRAEGKETAYKGPYKCASEYFFQRQILI